MHTSYTEQVVEFNKESSETGTHLQPLKLKGDTLQDRIKQNNRF